MKKSRKPEATRLLLSTEKLRDLQPEDLSKVTGGACTKSYGVPPPPGASA